jgi:uncharacterized membrane protein YbhN (UPF0104 family)
MRRQHRLLVLWTAASLVLLCALFPAFDTTPAAVLRALHSAPLSMYAVVILLTLANQLAGAQKWRLASEQLGGDGRRHDLAHAFETTALGAFLGQVMPIQVSTAMVRGMVGGRNRGGAATAIGATVHEQAYDFIVLLPAAVAGLVALILEWSAPTAGAAMLGAVAVAIVLAPRLIWLARDLLSVVRTQTKGRTARFMLDADRALFGASGVPRSLSLQLGMLSLVRAVCMAARIVVIAAVMAPAADALLIALGYPTVGIVGALPLTPAGLGLVEWSWSGLLIHAGSPAADAAAAAISMRVVNLLALGVILVALGGMRLARIGRGSVPRA